MSLDASTAAKLPLTFEQQQFAHEILSQFIAEGEWISKEGASHAILLAFEQGKSASKVGSVES